MSGSGAQSQDASRRLFSNYKNSSLSPENGIKSVGPVPIVSTEHIWQNHKVFGEGSKRPSTCILQAPKKQPGEGWGKFVDHTSFIETVFDKLSKEMKDAKRPTTGKSTNKGAKNTNVIQGDPELQKLYANVTMTNIAPRKLAAPWRSEGSFASPSALQKKTFESFYKMSPDPPKTPIKKSLGREAQYSAPGPAPHKYTGKGGTLTMSGICYIRDTSRMELNSNSKLSKSKLNVQPKLSKSRFAPRVGLYSVLKANRSPSLTSNSSVRVLSTISANNSKQRYTSASRILLGDKGQFSPPLPLSKRRDSFPQNQAPDYHKLYYGGRGAVPRRTSDHKSAETALPARGNQTTSKLSVKPEASPLGLVKKTKTNQIAQDKSSPLDANAKRRTRPSMLFPLHVPGPKQDHDFFIGDYHESESDTESDTEIAKKK